MNVIPVRGCFLLLLAASLSFSCAPPAPTTLRIATYNIEDTRTQDLKNPDHPRLKAAAALLQELKADILLINEITYDQPGTPGFEDGDNEGGNGHPIRSYVFSNALSKPIWMRSSTRCSQHQPTPALLVGTTWIEMVKYSMQFLKYQHLALMGKPAPQTREGRTYGGDSWGFGMFPGQYGMALYVREGLTILHDSVRTFRLLPWKAMPDALLPMQPGTDDLWYEGRCR